MGRGDPRGRRVVVRVWHSFSPGTRVLMADGTGKKLRDVRVGDKVIATGPTTGKRSVRQVELLHDNADRDLVD